MGRRKTARGPPRLSSTLKAISRLVAVLLLIASAGISALLLGVPRAGGVDGPTEVINIRVGSGTDDAEEEAGGSVSVGSRDLEMVNDGNEMVGMRFTGVGIPAGATIVDAFIQFTADETDSGPANFAIRAQAIDHAATFASSTNNISSRATTDAVVLWPPNPWTNVGDAGPNQRTPNLAVVIQEVIDGPDWVAGNSLVAIITGSGQRTAESFNGDAGGAALLHVEYRPSGP